MSVDFALLGFVEYALFLTAMDLDGLVLNLSSAKLYYTNYCFDVSKKYCEAQLSRVPTSK